MVGSKYNDTLPEQAAFIWDGGCAAQKCPRLASLQDFRMQSCEVRGTYETEFKRVIGSEIDVAQGVAVATNKKWDGTEPVPPV